MLPPPKRKLPVKTDVKSSLAVNKSMAAKPPPPPGMEDLDLGDLAGGEDDDPAPKTGLLLPSSMARAKAKAKAEKKAEEPVDLFGLGALNHVESLFRSAHALMSGTSSTPDLPQASSGPSAVPTSIVSAPSVPDFVPPQPTVDDPYPGYYQLPSGQWAEHDREYYNSFWRDQSASQQQDKVDDGRVGKHWDEYTRGADVVEVDVAKGLEEGRAEQARLEALKKPKIGDEFEYKVSLLDPLLLPLESFPC